MKRDGVNMDIWKVNWIGNFKSAPHFGAISTNITTPSTHDITTTTIPAPENHNRCAKYAFGRRTTRMKVGQNQGSLVQSISYVD